MATIWTGIVAAGATVGAFASAGVTVGSADIKIAGNNAGGLVLATASDGLGATSPIGNGVVSTSDELWLKNPTTVDLPLTLLIIPRGMTLSGNSFVSGASSTQVSAPLASLNATAFGAFDTSSYQSVSVQISGTFVGSVSFQVSNDGATWTAKALALAAAGTPASVSTAGGVYYGDIGARYFRVILTAYTSGSVTATALFDSFSLAPITGTSFTMGAGTAAIGNVLPGAGSKNLAVSAAAALTQLVKASSGSITELSVTNLTAAVVYLKLYDIATAPVAGVGTPLVTIPIPITSATQAPYQIEYGFLGKRFSTGIGYTVTGAITAADATAITAGVTVSATYF